MKITKGVVFTENEKRAIVETQRLVWELKQQFEKIYDKKTHQSVNLASFDMYMDFLNDLCVGIETYEVK